MDIGTTLRELRRRKNLTQTELGDALGGVAQTYLSEIEVNKKEPSPEMLRKICAFYGIPVAVVIWQSTGEKDINKKKLKAWKLIKPNVDELLKTFFQ